MSNMYFTSDLHFGHQNILIHQPNRGFSDIKEHDEWLLDLWRSTVKKNDSIYILGDLTYCKSERARQLLKQLSGKKYMVYGNHDYPIKEYSYFFQNASHVMDIVIKPNKCPVVSGNTFLSLCHYPLISWSRKPYGAIMLHGHVHGNLDDFNRQSSDLRFDVGIDGELSRKCGGLVPFDLIYEETMSKTSGQLFQEYARNAYESCFL